MKTIRRRTCLELLGLAALILWTGCAPAGPRPSPGTAAAPARSQLSPRELMLVKCSRCHAAGRAYSLMSARDRWIKTVAAMSARDISWISAADTRRIIAYFDDHPATAAAVFARKCGECHQLNSLRLMQKTPAQWKTMVNFMGGRAKTPPTADEAEILCQLLIQTP